MTSHTLSLLTFVVFYSCNYAQPNSTKPSSSEGKVSCSSKQWGLWISFELMSNRHSTDNAFDALTTEPLCHDHSLSNPIFAFVLRCQFCCTFFGKLILTGCCLVTRNVKAISTDLEHVLESVVTAIFYCINNTLLVSFFVHRKKSQDRFRIKNIVTCTEHQFEYLFMIMKKVTNLM